MKPLVLSVLVTGTRDCRRLESFFLNRVKTWRRGWGETEIDTLKQKSDPTDKGGEADDLSTPVEFVSPSDQETRRTGWRGRESRHKSNRGPGYITGPQSLVTDRERDDTICTTKRRQGIELLSVWIIHYYWHRDPLQSKVVRTVCRTAHLFTGPPPYVWMRLDRRVVPCDWVRTTRACQGRVFWSVCALCRDGTRKSGKIILLDVGI